MRSLPAVLAIIAVGILTFGVVFAVLQLAHSGAPSGAPIVQPTARPTPVEVQLVPVATDSVAPGLQADSVAIGVPSGGAEPLVQGLQPGDRLDVLVSLMSPDDGRPVTVVAVRGATVVRPATATDPLLLDVSSSEALALAHLVLGETPLSFVVWSNAGSPPVQQPMDERTARAALGLPPVAAAVSTVRPTPEATQVVPPVAATPQPVVPLASTPVPVVPVDTYTVQAGETFVSVADLLGVDPGALWWANRVDLDPLAPLVSGTRLHVPLVPGFLYQVQTGDTWDSVAAIFDLSTLTLRQGNDLPPESGLSPGSLMFIPTSL